MAAYSTAVIADGAVSYWRLNEPSGTVATDSVGTRHATISGPVTLGVPGGTGSTAMSFDATGTGLLTPPSLPSLGTAFTLEAWIKGAAFVSVPQSIIQRQIFSDGDFQWTIPGSATVVRLFYFSTSGQQFDIPLPAVGSWSYLAITAGVGQIRLYVNGALVSGPTAIVIGGAGAGPLALAGSTEAANWGWRGQLSDLAIYPTALTPAQIAAHYAAATVVVSTARRISFGMWRQILP